MVQAVGNPPARHRELGVKQPSANRLPGWSAAKYFREGGFRPRLCENTLST